jgi:hypothetical protein
MSHLSITFETLAIALALVGIMFIWVFVFAFVAQQLQSLVSLVGSKRADRKFFKKIERYRRDFS